MGSSTEAPNTMNNAKFGFDIACPNFKTIKVLLSQAFL